MDNRSSAGAQAGVVRSILLLLLLFFTAALRAQAPSRPATPSDVWTASSCAGCHGQTAMGGLGPPLAGTQLPPDKFLWTVRSGKGMMPAIPQSEVSDQEVFRIHEFVQSEKLDPSQIPISYKVGKLMSVERVGMGFGIIALISMLLALRVLMKWMDCAGLKQLRPHLGTIGYWRSLGVVVRSLLVDGLLVASLWRKSRFRWAMHGLMIYGFTGLWMGDALMQVFNPLRQTLPFSHPLKMLPNLCGLAILMGIFYVRYRYRKDEYIDNGLTLGRDYLFLNLLALTIVTGFLLQILRYKGAVLFIQPVYLLHLVLIAVLFLTAPFTRFAHAFVVPALVALTRLTDRIAESGQAVAFSWEPAPGRHHKSQRIAEGVLKALDPSFEAKVRIRYFP